MIIVEGNLAVRIPEIPSRYRANCSKDFGQFVCSNVGKLSCSKAEKAGLTRGSFVEMALCWVGNKVLTFEPHYSNEHFTEIWGIPVAGEMKTKFSDKASELSTFLIHRQSRDKFNALVGDFKRDAFNEWALTDMSLNADDFIESKISDYYFENIFRFEMIECKGEFGVYYYVQTTFRKPESDLEKAALKIAKQLYTGTVEGNGFCQDNRLEENNQKCLEASKQAALMPVTNVNNGTLIPNKN